MRIWLISICVSFGACQKSGSNQAFFESKKTLDDTMVEKHHHQFDYLLIENDLISFRGVEFVDTLQLGKITTRNCSKIDTVDWGEKLGAIPYFWFDEDSLEVSFNHGNFEGEEFFIVSRHQTKDFIWNIVGGFCGDNICTYHLLLQNRKQQILFFTMLGYVGFNYNPITVTHFGDNRLEYKMENCATDDYPGALSELSREEVRIELDGMRGKVDINHKILTWFQKGCKIEN